MRARALRSVSDPGIINKDLRKKCHALASSIDRVSARLKSNSRHICGDSTSHGKAAWSQVLLLHGQCEELSEKAFEQHVAAMKKFIDSVQIDGIFEDMFNSLADAIEGGVFLKALTKLMRDGFG